LNLNGNIANPTNISAKEPIRNTCSNDLPLKRESARPNIKVQFRALMGFNNIFPNKEKAQDVSLKARD